MLCTSIHTLVTLLLALNSNGQIFAGLPVNLVTFGVIVDEVTTVTSVFTVEVCLGDGAVGKEIVGGELEDESEAWLIEVLHADVGERFQCIFVEIGDEFGKRKLVLHGSQPEFWNTLGILGNLAFALDIDTILFILIVFVFTGLDFSLSWLDRSVYDLGSLLIQWSELGKVFLLEL